jgi:pimeloyl-ACP methyl ester carboxylesterase
MHEHRTLVDGVLLCVKRFGRGTPVVCLTAIGHDAQDFAPLAQRTAERCELICIEWPSHGESGADHATPSAARYADLIDGVLDQLALDRPIIIGNSIGGAVAILCAARRPVGGLVLCDSGGLVEVTRTVATFCRIFERFFAAGARGAWWYPAAFAAYYRLVLPQQAAAAQRRRIVARARDLAGLLRDAWASFGTPAADIRGIAASLDVPVWVAWARRDRVIPLSACRPAIRRMRQVTLDTFAAGHTPFLEQPDAFARAFGDFLARVPHTAGGAARRASA